MSSLIYTTGVKSCTPVGSFDVYSSEIKIHSTKTVKFVPFFTNTNVFLLCSEGVLLNTNAMVQVIRPFPLSKYSTWDFVVNIPWGAGAEYSLGSGSSGQHQV